MRKAMQKVVPRGHINTHRHTLRAALRTTKSYSLDPDILDYIEKTKGELSASERVNQLLRQAMLTDQYRALEQEAAEFFSATSREERKEAKAFQAATRRSLARD